jgi:hypothetical protein
MPSEPKVGPERPSGPAQRGMYTGDRPELRHKTALISRCQGGWNIQADKISTGFGLGWWQFPYEDWRLR